MNKDKCEITAEEHLKERAIEKGVPLRTINGLIRYVLYGIKPGSFLVAVLSNDLFGSFGKADEENRENLFNICQFIYNDLPLNCWGSEEIVDKWIEEKA